MLSFVPKHWRKWYDQLQFYLEATESESWAKKKLFTILFKVGRVIMRISKFLSFLFKNNIYF